MFSVSIFWLVDSMYERGGLLCSLSLCRYSSPRRVDDIWLVYRNVWHRMASHGWIIRVPICRMNVGFIFTLNGLEYLFFPHFLSPPNLKPAPFSLHLLFIFCFCFFILALIPPPLLDSSLSSSSSSSSSCSASSSPSFAPSSLTWPTGVSSEEESEAKKEQRLVSRSRFSLRIRGWIYSPWETPLRWYHHCDNGGFRKARTPNGPQGVHHSPLTFLRLLSLRFSNVVNFPLCCLAFLSPLSLLLWDRKSVV